MIIKICGITTLKEAAILNKYGADMAGFVLFCPKSIRNVSIQTAQIIMRGLLPNIKKTAVVVSPTAQQLSQIEKAGFDYIQIHGSLRSDVIKKANKPILRAFNVTDMDNYETYRDNPQIAGYVFDAAEPGSGKTFDWSLVKNVPRDDKLFILAGGLNPENVADAVKYLKPDGVDVSSGVEFDNANIRGKDQRMVKAFVKNAREAALQYLTF